MDVTRPGLPAANVDGGLVPLDVSAYRDVVADAVVEGDTANCAVGLYDDDDDDGKPVVTDGDEYCCCAVVAAPVDCCPPGLTVLTVVVDGGPATSLSTLLLFR